MIFKAESSPGDLNGFVDRGSHVQGELHFDTSFRVDGKVTGTVVSQGSLAIGEHGEVDGEVRVGQVFVAGMLRGTVEALRKIQVAPGGRVYADLSTPALVIEDGAIFEGRCSMTRREKPAPASTAGPKLVAKVPAGEKR